jgi:hypothetical protein
VIEFVLPFSYLLWLIIFMALSSGFRVLLARAAALAALIAAIGTRARRRLVVVLFVTRILAG